MAFVFQITVMPVGMVGGTPWWHMCRETSLNFQLLAKNDHLVLFQIYLCLRNVDKQPLKVKWLYQKNVLLLLTKMHLFSSQSSISLLLFGYLDFLKEEHAPCLARLLLSILDTYIAYGPHFWLRISRYTWGSSTT